MFRSVEEATDAGNQESKEIGLAGSQEDKSDSGISGVGDEDDIDEDDYVAQLFGTKIKLNMGRPPQPEELALTDEVYGFSLF